MTAKRDALREATVDRHLDPEIQPFLRHRMGCNCDARMTKLHFNARCARFAECLDKPEILP